jgi:hypothetical protein
VGLVSSFNFKHIFIENAMHHPTINGFKIDSKHTHSQLRKTIKNYLRNVPYKRKR